MSDYTIYYWSAPFRGDFARLPLVYAKVPYNEASTKDIVGIRKRAPEDQPYPVMAPPMLGHGETFLNQMPALVYCLGEQLDLLPESAAGRAQVIKTICDCNDVLGEITRHNRAQMWTPETWADFVGGRFVRWLRIFEAVGVHHGLSENAGAFLGGDKVTVVDLSVFALWGTMTRCLPAIEPVLRKHAPSVMSLCDRIAVTPQVVAFLAAQHEVYGDRYAGGEIEASIRSMLANA